MFTTPLAARRLLALVVAVVGFGLTSSLASAAPATYTHTQTIPVPPASNYAGVGGGDGWGISLSSSSVYNVFHHSSQVTVACHRQSDASQCWPSKTVQDGGGNSFNSAAQSGTYLDQATGRLFIVGRRASDQTMGIICFDTVAAEGAGSPFCGYTPLTGAGDAAQPSQSSPLVTGGRLYTFNPQNATGDAGATNRMLCFDLAAQAACAGQPYSVGISGTVSTGAFPAPAATLLAGKAYVPLRVDGTVAVHCFDTTTNAPCGGSWPQPAPGIDPQNVGAAFPVLSASGTPTGFCLPEGPGSPCFTLAGAALTVPAALDAALPRSSGWNGPAVTIGPRAYYASNEEQGSSTDRITCWDYLAGAACQNFPKTPTGAGYIYTVNPDPQRPDCLWINADYGQAQIQNFDAFSGGACGTGAIRVISSAFVAPLAQCAPTKYLALRLVDPIRSAYASGTMTIADASGTPLPGPPLTLDGSGTASLEAVPIDPAVGLPQFIIALTGAPAQQQAVTVELSWRADYDAACATPGTLAAADPTPTPAPTQSAAPTPTPAPQGGVLAARAAPRLVGTARFGARSLRVGRTTTLRVAISNTGNAASTSGEVCVRLSPALVVLKVPSGVTVKGSTLCAKRGAVNAGASTTVVRGIVVRGVTPTRRAAVRDGRDDGVSISGDQLRVLRQTVRGGGVTG
jgi:hypothetical protein